MTLVNRLDGFQSIIESAKAQVSGSANTQLVEELSQVGAFLKDIGELATALQAQENITQSNPDILTLTTLLTGNIARVLKPALAAQTVQVQPVAVAQAAVPADLQAQFDAGIQQERATQTSEDTLTADIQRQIAEQQSQQAQAQAQEAQEVRATRPAPTGVPTQAEVEYRQGQGWVPPTQPFPMPAGLPTQAEVQAQQQPQQIVIAGTLAPVGGQDLTAQFRPQITQQAPVAQPGQAVPVPPIAQTVQAEDPLTASIRAQVSGQAAPVAQPAPVNPVQDALQQAFDAGLKEVRGQ